MHTVQSTTRHSITPSPAKSSILTRDLLVAGGATALDQPNTTEIAPMPRTKPNPRNAEVGFRGEKRSNVTHASTMDPDAVAGCSR
ncbi:hypothetical protein SAMN04488021_16412 [Paracoccus aminovorans]|uniref:Uncharacterized protein n=1 Tax=Paracoccus aminovorans TaxID=34004 RepID=A0A1I3F9L0_9RHOB|nr:IS5 family transposase [Paracoccus aminovorans]SFI07551.1 hypothetical protein SAMN04488021_16412 [Paracoccus aminovorans]